MASSKLKLITLVILSVFIAGIYSYPTQADEIKTTTNIGSAFDIVGHKGLIKACEKGLTSTLNKKITIEDNVITFTESLFDGSKIYIETVMNTILMKRLKELNGQSINIKQPFDQCLLYMVSYI